MKLPGKKISYVILSLLLLFAFTEVLFRLFFFPSDSVLESAYQAIVRDNSAVGYLSQPYLNYINNPHLRDRAGNAEINSMGIRYPREISLQKPDSVYRILFLGGSTTFGDVDDDYAVFPALIEQQLNDSIHILHPAYKQMECLNAGVHGLTSAELLTHFQFKYQYLQPDLVVLHTGFNDAFMYAGINNAPYQPDYHNSRRVFRDVPEVTKWERRLLHSKLIAYFLLKSRFSDYLKTTLEDNIFFRHTHEQLWFSPGNAGIADSATNAFYNNITTLVNVAKRRKTDVLLVPEVCDSTKMPAPLDSLLPAGFRTNRKFMKKIAQELSVHYCHLPDEQFPPEFFLDDDGIHVNEQGERRKAEFIGSCIQEILRQRAKNI